MARKVFSRKMQPLVIRGGRTTLIGLLRQPSPMRPLFFETGINPAIRRAVTSFRLFGPRR